MARFREPDAFDALRDPDGLQLERPIDARILDVPGMVSLSDGLLEWRWIPGQKREQVRPGILEGFLKLADAADSSILAFAKKWGPLGICEHELPSTHSADCS